jgi:sugar phosphate isomerase/epimerase
MAGMKSKRMIDWLLISLAALGTGCADTGGPLLTRPVGLELYSVRDQLARDVPGTLDEVHRWGIIFVELAGTYKLSPAEFKAELDAHWLTPVSGLFPYERWRDDPEGVLRDADKLGLSYAGCAWIPHQGAFDEVACRQAAAVFNKAGELAAKHEMRFFYHTHGYEFQPFDHGTLFDLLARETNPDRVKFEMDIFWVAHAGQDPVQWLGKYPGRWTFMHLKDMKKGTETGLLTGSSPVSNDVTLGAGQLHIPEILRAARDARVKWFFIEDESAVSEQQIPESLRYLQGLR